MSERILVIKLGALGDVVQALGAVAAIRRHHAAARVILMTTAPFQSLFAACPDVDETWIDDRPRLWQLGAWIDLRRRLRAAGFKRVYDLQTSDRSSLYFRLLGPGRRPEWSGIAAGCSHPHANPDRDFMHTLDRQVEQLRDAGIAGAIPPPDVSWLTADLARYELPPRFAVLVPGGSAARPRKRWPADRYGALAAELAKRGFTALVLGAPGERPLAAAIRAVCPSARDLTGQTSFAEIAALARKAELAVGNDTGPMHLIAATGCRALVLFSADSDPNLCAPRGNVMVLRQTDLGELPVVDVASALPA
ncbi:MAG TPA: glycosyltransferase family 9 protein [Alphaproteobacteria bacterium]